MSNAFKPQAPLAFIALADLHRREATIRIGGLLIVPPAVLLLLFVAYHVEPWTPDPTEFWTAKLFFVMAVCLLAALTGWGLFELRRWSRWALSIAATALTPVSVYVLSLYFRIIRENDVWMVELTALIAATSWIPLLLILWSPNGRTVFAPEYRRVVGKRQWGGWLGVVGAVFFAGLQLIAYFSVILGTFYLLMVSGFAR